MQNPAKALISFAENTELEDVPREIVAQSKLSILDGLGTALLSTGLEKSRHIASAIRSINPNGMSMVWGYGFRTPPLASTIVNGMLVEALDFSDIHVGAGLHPTSVIAPALFAHGETVGASGKSILLSHIIGSEIMIRLGLSAPGRFHSRGFQPTSAVGVLGAALAVGRMIGLTRSEMMNALGIGTTIAFGSPLSVRVGAYYGGIDAGRAAEGGLLSAILAHQRVSAIAGDPLQGRFGFLETYAGSSYNSERIVRGLGSRWEMRGVFFKRYPTSYACTFVLDAALRLAKGMMAKPSDIKEIRFGDNRQSLELFAMPNSARRMSGSIYEAKTSFQFLLALALTKGLVTAETLQMFNDSEVLNVAKRVVPIRDENEKWVEVRLIDGSRLRETQNVLVPTSENQVRLKYRRNASPVLGEKTAKKLERIIGSLDRLKDVAEVTESMAGDPRFLQ